MLEAADAGTLQTLLNEAGDLGFGLAGIVPSYAPGQDPLLVLARTCGVAIIEIEAPERSVVSPVSLVPGNGSPPRGFRGHRG